MGAWGEIIVHGYALKSYSVKQLLQLEHWLRASQGPPEFYIRHLGFPSKQRLLSKVQALEWSLCQGWDFLQPTGFSVVSSSAALPSSLVTWSFDISVLWHLLLLNMEPRPKVAGGFWVPSTSEHGLGLCCHVGSVVPSDSDRAQSRPSGDELLWSTISSFDPH